MVAGPSSTGPRIDDRRLAPSDGAVADVLGAILLVGLTVGMTVVLGGLLMTYDGPRATPHARLSITASPGAGGWDTNDETIRVQHLGGDPLEAGTRVLIRINGVVVTDLSGAALGDTFADGRLVVGETWTHTPTNGITLGELIGVDVVGQGEGTAILASVALVAAPAGGP